MVLIFRDIKVCKKQCCAKYMNSNFNSINNAKEKFSFKQEWFNDSENIAFNYQISDIQEKLFSSWIKENKGNKFILKNLLAKKKFIDLNNLLFKSNEYIVVDIETTGLNPELNESLIQFGYVILNKNLKIVKQGEFLVKHYHQDGSLKTPFYNNIPVEKIAKEGLEVEEATLKLMELLKNRTIVAHNKKFDISFLHWYIGAYVFDYGTDYEKIYWKEYFLNLNDNYVAHICTGNFYKMWKLSKTFLTSEPKKWNLKLVCNELNISYDLYIAHTSLYDAQKAKEVFIKCYTDLNIGKQNWN